MDKLKIKKLKNLNFQETKSLKIKNFKKIKNVQASKS